MVLAVALDLAVGDTIVEFTPDGTMEIDRVPLNDGGGYEAQVRRTHKGRRR